MFSLFPGTQGFFITVALCIACSKSQHKPFLTGHKDGNEAGISAPYLRCNGLSRPFFGSPSYNISLFFVPFSIGRFPPYAYLVCHRGVRRP